MALDEHTVNSIWRAFGSYVAKQLRNGKGVCVPKFGNFTFSAPNVDLAVALIFLNLAVDYQPRREGQAVP